MRAFARSLACGRVTVPISTFPGPSGFDTTETNKLDTEIPGAQDSGDSRARKKFDACARHISHAVSISQTTADDSNVCTLLRISDDFDSSTLPLKTVKTGQIVTAEAITLRMSVNTRLRLWFTRGISHVRCSSLGVVRVWREVRRGIKNSRPAHGRQRNLVFTVVFVSVVVSRTFASAGTGRSPRFSTPTV